jgi:hypothetical protein
MPDRDSLPRLSCSVLRDAGYTDEAARLEAAVRRARLWGTSASEDVLALSLFGSIRHDELTAALRLREAAA